MQNLYKPLESKLFKLEADLTISEVTHEAYFENGLQLKKQGTG